MSEKNIEIKAKIKLEGLEEQVDKLGNYVGKKLSSEVSNAVSSAFIKTQAKMQSTMTKAVNVSSSSSEVRNFDSSDGSTGYLSREHKLREEIRKDVTHLRDSLVVIRSIEKSNVNDLKGQEQERRKISDILTNQIDKEEQILKIRAKQGSAPQRYPHEFLQEGGARVAGRYKQQFATGDINIGELRQIEGLINNITRAGSSNMLGIAFRRVMLWGTAGGAVYGTIRALREMKSAIKDIEVMMNELRRVMGPLTTDFVKLQETAFAAADKFATPIREVGEAMRELAKTGLNQQQIEDVLPAALIAKNVGDISPEQGVKYLTSTQAQYNMEAKDSLAIMDQWTYLADITRASTIDMADGVTYSAASAKIAGVTFKELNATIATLVETTGRSGKEVGNALKFMYARVYSTGASKLESMGISTKEGNELRAFGDILGEIASKWNSFSGGEKLKIGEAIAEKRRLPIILNLIENYDKYQEMVVAAGEAEGTALKKNEIMMKSYAKQVEQLKNLWVEFSSSLGEAGLLPALKLVNSGLSTFLRILNAIPTPIKTIALSIGGLVGALKLMGFYMKNMGKGQSSWKDNLGFLGQMVKGSPSMLAAKLGGFLGILDEDQISSAVDKVLNPNTNKKPWLDSVKKPSMFVKNRAKAKKIVPGIVDSILSTSEAAAYMAISSKVSSANKGNPLINTEFWAKRFFDKEYKAPDRRKLSRTTLDKIMGHDIGWSDEVPSMQGKMALAPKKMPADFMENLMWGVMYNSMISTELKGAPRASRYKKYKLALRESQKQHYKDTGSPFASSKAAALDLATTLGIGLKETNIKTKLGEFYKNFLTQVKAGNHAIMAAFSNLGAGIIGVLDKSIKGFIALNPYARLAVAAAGAVAVVYGALTYASIQQAKKRAEVAKGSEGTIEELNKLKDKQSIEKLNVTEKIRLFQLEDKLINLMPEKIDLITKEGDAYSVTKSELEAYRKELENFKGPVDKGVKGISNWLSAYHYGPMVGGQDYKLLIDGKYEKLSTPPGFDKSYSPFADPTQIKRDVDDAIRQYEQAKKDILRIQNELDVAMKKSQPHGKPEYGIKGFLKDAGRFVGDMFVGGSNSIMPGVGSLFGMRDYQTRKPYDAGEADRFARQYLKDAKIKISEKATNEIVSEYVKTFDKSSNFFAGIKDAINKAKHNNSEIAEAAEGAAEGLKFTADELKKNFLEPLNSIWEMGSKTKSTADLGIRIEQYRAFDFLGDVQGKTESLLFELEKIKTLTKKKAIAEALTSIKDDFSNMLPAVQGVLEAIKGVAEWTGKRISAVHGLDMLKSAYPMFSDVGLESPYKSAIGDVQAAKKQLEAEINKLPKEDAISRNALIEQYKGVYDQEKAIEDARFQEKEKAEQDAKDAAKQKEQHRKDLQNLQKARFDAEKRYLSYLINTEKLGTAQELLILNTLKSQASPETRLDLEEQIFQTRRRLLEKTMGSAEGWISHFTTMGNLSPDAQVSAWKKVLQIIKSKGAKTEDIWKVEENIYNAQQENLEKTNDFAREMIKRAAGLAGPMGVSFLEYRKMMGEDNKLDKAKDTLKMSSDTAVQAMVRWITGQDKATMSTDKAKAEMLKYSSTTVKAADYINNETKAKREYTKSLQDSALKLWEWRKQLMGANGQLDQFASSMTKVFASITKMTTDESGKPISAFTALIRTLDKLSGKIDEAALNPALKNGASSLDGKINESPTFGWFNKKFGAGAFPVTGGTFSNDFFDRRSGGRTHKAADIFAKAGSPIYAMFGGKITKANFKNTGLGGISLSVKDQKTKFSAYYAHLQSIAKGIGKGDTVLPGQLLGYVGNTGNAKNTPSHLHLGLKNSQGQNFNPYDWLTELKKNPTLMPFMSNPSYKAAGVMYEDNSVVNINGTNLNANEVKKIIDDSNKQKIAEIERNFGRTGYAGLLA